MDSFADLPAVTGPPEPHAAEPSFTGNGAHPPYSEMIIAAIAALKDKDGSSRQAIAKYIEKEYANLPPTHQNLLTHHLKSMKNQGELMMVKHSYMIPPLRSVPFQPQIPMDHHNFTNDYTITAETFTTNTAAPAADNSNSNSTLIPRRKPGRPPKPRQDFGYQVQGSGEQQPPPPPEIQPYQPQFEQQHHMNSGQDFQTGQDLQSQYGSGQEGNSNYAGGAEPMFASLGLADDGVAPPPENPVPISAKRGRGRPPKVKFAGVNTSAERRKPGRPPISMVNGVKRGRPKRVGGPGPGPVPLSGNGYVSTGRPRGRPKRQPAQYVSVENAPVSRGRGRGRPPKNSFRNLTSQSYGPPTKVGPGTAVLVTDPHQLVAYQELKSKYEHLQSKAKEVVGVVRPYINPDYEAFGALQELENLVGPAPAPEVNVQSEKQPSFV